MSGASASGYVLGPGEGKSTWFLETLMTVKAGHAETGGAFTLLEWSAPAGFSPPVHLHRVEDEAFYILEGSMSVRCGERSWDAGPGSFVYLPHGIEHVFTVTGDAPLRGLQLTLPAGFEEFIEEAGMLAGELTLPQPSAPDVPRLLAAAERHNVEIRVPAHSE